jgi:hypothetical protein
VRAASDAARRLRGCSDPDDDGVVIVILPRGLARRALEGVGYRPAPEGCWDGPDGERYRSLVDATCIEVTAATVAAGEGHRDPGPRRAPAEAAGAEDGNPGAGAEAVDPMIAARLRFGENIERLRRESGCPPDTLATRSCIPLDEIEEMVRGDREATANDIYLLAGALGVEPNLLFEGIRRNPPASGGSGYEIAGGEDD